MKKFLEELEKEEESEEEKRSDDGAHTETWGIAQEYLERGGGKEKGKFDQIIRDMGCEAIREAKQLAGDRAEWRRVVASNQPQDCVFNDDDDVHYLKKKKKKIVMMAKSHFNWLQTLKKERISLRNVGL